MLQLHVNCGGGRWPVDGHSRGFCPYTDNITMDEAMTRRVTLSIRRARRAHLQQQDGRANTIAIWTSTTTFGTRQVMTTRTLPHQGRALQYMDEHCSTWTKMTCWMTGRRRWGMGSTCRLQKFTSVEKPITSKRQMY
jgi:hypothetical protein